MAQIFTLVAYLAIALMSVTVPTYAIAISYLARESSKSMEDLKKRRKDLAQKLDQLKKELEEKPGVEAIKGEIGNYEKEEAELKDRLGCLSAKGAVGYPFASFMVALVFASYNIYANILDPLTSLLSIGVIVMAMGFGIFRLGKTLVAIEQAALRPEEALLPAFRVAFMSGATVERFKPGEQKELTFVVTNYGKETAEDTDIMFFFPGKFGVLPRPNYSIIEQPPVPLVQYPGRIAVRFEVSKFHVDYVIPFAVSVSMPDTLGKYDIPVVIRARRIGKSEHEVSVEIA